MKVSLRDIVLAVRYGDAALVAESSGYLVLGAADLSLDVPRRVSLDGIYLSDDGVLSVDAAPCPFADCERDLRKVLKQLLALVRTPCRNLSRVAERTDACGLEHLVRELEAALVPVNRKAARRSLGRLARETARAAAKVAAQAAVVEREAPINENLTPLVGHENLSLGVADLESAELAAGESVPAVLEAEEIEITDAELLDATCPPPATVGVAASAILQAPVPEHVSIRETAVQETEDPTRRPTLKFDPQLVAQFASGFGARTPSEVAPVAAVAPEPQLDELDDAPTTLFGGAEQVAEIAPPRPDVHVAGPSFSPLELSPASPPVVDRAPRVPRSLIETPPPAFVQAPRLPSSKPASSRPPNAETAGRDTSAGDFVAPAPAQPAAAQTRPTSGGARRQTGRRKAAIAPDVSLIPQSDDASRRRPSDISELLDRMPMNEQPDDELYAGLKSLSRVELSPAAPPVAADWMGETGSY